MDRLTKRGTLDGKEAIKIGSTLYFGEQNPSLFVALNKLARYEDLADDGKLKELPCREGTGVYKITTQRDSFDDREYPTIIQASFRLDMLNNFGKTVFLTHEAAEAKLAGGNNEDNL